jgi:hypothetical protein
MSEAGCLDDPPAEDCPRVALPPLEVIRDVIKDGMLDDESGLSDAARARLLTALNLPSDYQPTAHLGPQPVPGAGDSGQSNAPANPEQ